MTLPYRRHIIFCTAGLAESAVYFWHRIAAVSKLTPHKIQTTFKNENSMERKNREKNFFFLVFSYVQYTVVISIGLRTNDVTTTAMCSTTVLYIVLYILVYKHLNMNCLNLLPWQRPIHFITLLQVYLILQRLNTHSMYHACRVAKPSGSVLQKTEFGSLEDGFGCQC